MYLSKNNLCKLILTSILIIMTGNANAWIEHAYLSYLALENESSSFNPDQMVEVSPLSTFLNRNKQQVALFIKNNDEWSTKNIPGYRPTPKNIMFDPATCTPNLTTCFIKAIRINPTLPLTDIAFDPDDDLKEYPIVAPISILMIKDAYKPALNAALKNKIRLLPQNGRATIQSIIAANSNVPDFGMDSMLYEDNSDFGREYGFGEQPVLPKNYAPFTEALFNTSTYYTNSMVLKLLPELNGSYVEYRFRLFMGLAKIAYQDHNLYWASRFTAWGLYYLQEMTQPYNAYIYTGYSSMRAVSVILLAKFYTQPYEKMKRNIIARKRLTNLTALYLMHSETLGTTMLQHSLEDITYDDDIPQCSIDYDYLTKHVIKDSYYINQDFSSIIVKNYPKHLTSQGNELNLQMINVEELYDDLTPTKKNKLNLEFSDRFKIMGSYTRSCVYMIFNAKNK